MNKLSDQTYAITGGRDGILRVWKMSRNMEADIELYDELIHHDNYITSIAVNHKLFAFYSADWNGLLIEWSKKRNTNEKNVGSSYHMSR